MRGKAPDRHPAGAAGGITPAYAGKRIFKAWCGFSGRDHPRVCGEKGESCRSFSPGRGSPPRMRGKGQSQWYQLAEAGITPAYAGKRRKNGNCSNTNWDHPRVCGEKLPLVRVAYPVGGSPPRMRGKVRFRFQCVQGHRDHPRVCGEKKLLNHSDPAITGSPPRMRGKEHYAGLDYDPIRITPAYAGKRFF